MSDQPQPSSVGPPAAQATYRYDAFISYRHVEPDRQWAKWLHGALETYRVPRKLVRLKGLPRRVGRVFRDEEELPASEDLNAEIESALSQSRHLIVVCSPRAPLSRWVNREVQRFRELGRHEHILALLIEGEPADSFPPALREIRHTVVDRDGGSYERIEEVEPLAADVRAARHETQRYLRRMAKLRVLASILGVKFDDLRRREQERRTRRLTYLGALLAVLLCVVGGLALYAVRQRNIAVEQRREAVAQRQRAEVELAQGMVLQGDLLGSAGRWVEARGKYVDAADLFSRNGAPPVMAELGLWDASRHVYPPLNVLSGGHTGLVWAVAISPDGRRVLSGGADKALRLWDLRGGQLLRSLPGHETTVHAVAFLPDGKHAISGDDDGVVKRWDLTLPDAPPLDGPHGAAIRCLATAADGRCISGDAAGNVKLWNTDGSAARTIRIAAYATTTPATAPAASAPAPPSIFALAFSADGKQALASGSDAKIRLLDLTTGNVVRTLAGHEIAATAVAFLPDGTSALSTGYDNDFHVWDLATGKTVRQFSNPTDRLGGAAISADGKTAVAGLWDGSVRAFDVASGELRRTFVGGHSASLVRSVAITPDGRAAVSAGPDKHLVVWDLAGGHAQNSWSYHVPVAEVAFAADGRLAFDVTASGRMELWDLATSQTLFAARMPRDVVFAAALAPDGRTVLAGGVSSLVIMDLSGARPPMPLAGHPGGIVDAVAISPDGKTGLSGGDDQTARVWDLASGRELRTLPHPGRVTSVAFSPDGRQAVSGGLGGVHLWDAVAGLQLRMLAPPATGSADAMTSLAFAPDSRSVLAGTQVGTVLLLDAAGTRPPRPFAGGHTRTVGRVAFAADGRRAASASDDRTVKLWDVASGTELRTLVGHDGQARTVALSADGSTLLSGGLDGNLIRWNTAAPAGTARRRDALAAARDALTRAPADAPANAAYLSALGDWYEWRLLPDWAADVLERARAGGAPVSPLLLGRCYWESNRPADARRELAEALRRHEAPDTYLHTCLDALDRAAHPP